MNKARGTSKEREIERQRVKDRLLGEGFFQTAQFQDDSLKAGYAALVELVRCKLPDVREIDQMNGGTVFQQCR